MKFNAEAFPLNHAESSSDLEATKKNKPEEKLEVVHRDESIEDVRNSKLIQEAQNGNREALDELIKNHSGLVVFFAKKFKSKLSLGNSISFEDLVQEGKIALATAIERYDSDKGAKFSTYASLVIRREIHRFIQNNARMIRVPVGMEEKLPRYNELTGDENFSIDEEDLLRELDVTAREIKLLQKAKASSQKISSIDKPIATSSDSDLYLKDVIASPETELDVLVGQKIDKENLKKIIQETLSEKEFDILCLSMGLDERGKLTMQEIGELYGGVSRQRIDQIEKKARKKLMKNQELRDISSEILEN